jgi:hypothetical protein
LLHSNQSLLYFRSLVLICLLRLTVLWIDAVSSSDNGANTDQPVMSQVCCLPPGSLCCSLILSSGPMPSLSPRIKHSPQSVKRLEETTPPLTAPLTSFPNPSRSTATESSESANRRWSGSWMLSINNTLQLALPSSALSCLQVRSSNSGHNLKALR